MLIKTPDLDFYYNIYRNEELWVTCLTWKEVLDFIFDDHVKTFGVFNYRFEQVDKRVKNEKENMHVQLQVLRLDV